MLRDARCQRRTISASLSRLSDPDVVRRGQAAARGACVDNPARLDDQGVTFRCGTCDVFNTLWHHKHFPLLQGDVPITESDLHLAGDNEEDLVGSVMRVPDEVALDLDQLELDVIHLGDHPRRPMRVDQGQSYDQIDRNIGHEWV